MILIWRAIIGFLGGPVVKGLLSAYQSYLGAQTTDQQTAATLAAREVALQQREAELQTKIKIAEIGHWAEPDKLMAYAVAIYFGKILIWDKCFHLGTTDTLTGFAASTAALIVSFYFARRTFENVARIIKK